MLILLMLPLRMICSLSEKVVILENIMVIAAALTTSMHCLFFLRALKFIGPFILMVYKIILNDIIKFLMIYSIFLLGFSQVFFIVFKSCERNSEENFENIFYNPGEGLLRMFIMSIGEFTSVYKNLHMCKGIMGIIGKVLFVIYELLVTVMLLNLLIAMMTRTYERIAETQKEWKRQWAQVVLMLEQSLHPAHRLQYMINYSRPLKMDKCNRALIVRQHKEEYKTILITKKSIYPKRRLKRLLVCLRYILSRKAYFYFSDYHFKL